jgi:hypothetical protein
MVSRHTRQHVLTVKDMPVVSPTPNNLTLVGDMLGRKLSNALQTVLLFDHSGLLQVLPSSEHDSKHFTTNTGTPVWNNIDSLTVGQRGPVLMEGTASALSLPRWFLLCALCFSSVVVSPAVSPALLLPCWGHCCSNMLTTRGVT